MSEKITPRQLMVLRFWDRGDLAKTTRAEVSEWIDQWHATPKHQAAWTWWKLENANIDEVEVGLSTHYISRLEGAETGPGTWFDLMAQGAEEVEDAFASYVETNIHIEDPSLDVLSKNRLFEFQRKIFFGITPPRCGEERQEYAKRFLQAAGQLTNLTHTTP